MARRRSRKKQRAQPTPVTPTNGEIFYTSILVLWMVVLFIADIMLTAFMWYLEETRPTMHPQLPSLYHQPSSKFVFMVSGVVGGVSLIVPLHIMSVIGTDQSQGPRLIILYHKAFLGVVYVANWILWIVRSEEVQCVNDEFLLVFIPSVLLVQAEKEGLLVMFLDWVKRMFMECSALEWMRKLRGRLYIVF